jgi:hypothetical protein
MNTLLMLRKQLFSDPYYRTCYNLIPLVMQSSPQIFLKYCKCDTSLHHINNDVDESRRKPQMMMLKQSQQEIMILAKLSANSISTTLKSISDCRSLTTLLDSIGFTDSCPIKESSAIDLSILIMLLSTPNFSLRTLDETLMLAWLMHMAFTLCLYSPLQSPRTCK